MKSLNYGKYVCQSLREILYRPFNVKTKTKDAKIDFYDQLKVGNAKYSNLNF